MTDACEKNKVSLTLACVDAMTDCVHVLREIVYGGHLSDKPELDDQARAALKALEHERKE